MKAKISKEPFGNVQPVQEAQYRTETGQRFTTDRSSKRSRLPKTHVDYWAARLKKRKYETKQGETEIQSWQVRLWHDQKEGWFNLHTSNKAEAASKAKEIYIFLKANGWGATLEKYRPKSDTVDRNQLTVGQFLSAVTKTHHLSAGTLRNYTNCLRTIVSGVFGIKSSKSKFDYKTGGQKKWCARIDATRLQKLTPDRVEKWRRTYLSSVGRSPDKLASARRSLNSYVRGARSLFSPEILKQLTGIELPIQLPFDGLKLLESGSSKYVSNIDAKALIAAARNELKPSDPESYKAFLLGLGAGMRKKEIDLCEWTMLDFANSIIRLRETKWLSLKTSDSAGSIDVDPEFMTELRTLRTGTSEFVINSSIPPRRADHRQFYRCAPIFERLTTWLRGKGITANKPLHELRKEIGALIASEVGIYAAASFLRHSDITTTARHYADQKKRISVGLGRMLDTEIKVATPEKVA